METRHVLRPVECRKAGESDPPKIVGYAAVFWRADDPGTEYALWPGAVERVMPGAFDHALSDDDVRATFDHRALLGRKGASTLALSVDDVGLRYEISPSDTIAYHDTIEHIRLGNVTGSSFGFAIRSSRGEEWFNEKRGDGWIEVRELRDVILFDVGPVVVPAYQAATAAVRGIPESMAEAREARERWAKQIEAVKQDAIRRESLLREMQLPKLSR